MEEIGFLFLFAAVVSLAREIHYRQVFEAELEEKIVETRRVQQQSRRPTRE